MTLSRLSHLTAIALCVSACGGGAATPDAGIGADAAPIDRRSPADLDGDEWANEGDNCPMDFNPEQRDRDRDGVGDPCDSCPATPNGGEGGALDQAACAIVQEQEPNDAPGQSLAVRPLGAAAAVRGFIERGGKDAYRVELPARALYRIRVARAGTSSLLEPKLSVGGGAFTATRHAEGLFVAERELYVSSAGTYAIDVEDRRGDANLGGEAYGYELSVLALELTAEGLSFPVNERRIRLEPAGKVGVYEVDLPAAQRTRILVRSPITARSPLGIDPILIVEGPDGAFVAENDDFVEGKRDARVFGPLAAGRVRLVVEHARVLGEGALELVLSVDQPPENFEVEPNDTVALASPLVNPGQSRGLIDAPADGVADVDVWTFEAMAGAVAGFRGLVDTNSQIDPHLALARVVGGQLEPLYENNDSSGISARIDAILPVTGTYALIVSDQRNRMPGAMARGGLLFPYTIFAEPLGLQPAGELTSSGDIQGVLNPGGALVRYLATASVGPTLLELDTTAVGVPDEVRPHLRVYGASARGVLADGERTTFAILPRPGAYPIGIHNALEGRGGLNFSFTVAARMTPLAEAPDAEPNDATPQALPALPAGLVGALDPESDVDRFSFELATGGGVEALVARPSGAVVLTLSRGGAEVASGAAAIRAYRSPSAATHTLSVSGAAGPYAIAVRARP